MKGKFISLEGGEGAGKTSAVLAIQEWLEQHDIEYVLTREPGGTPMAEEVRELIIKARDEEVSAKAELLLVFAARVQHLHGLVEPALAQGKWVISDRFLDSSYVYQGVARGLGESIIDVLTENFIADALPDRTLLLDVPVEIGLERVANRGDANRLDGESRAFHEKVRQGFLGRAEQEPNRVSVIDASQDLESVQAQIYQVLDALLADR